MSLRANIDHLAAAQGIVAVAVVGDAGPHEFRGDTTWNPVLESALNLLQKTDESTIRLVIGKHTIVLQSEGQETVAVVLPTGHSIAKSLRRMIRRMSRKVRGPLRPEQPSAPVAANLASPASQQPSAHQPPASPAPSAQPSAAPQPATSSPSSGESSEEDQPPTHQERFSPWSR